MINGLKLSVLRRNPDVRVRRTNEGPYLVEYGERAWLLWLSSSRWVEINPDDHDDRLGDMHYGPIAVFHEKYIRRKQALPENHGKLWVDEDIECLYELIDEDVPIQGIADRMGRSVSSVIAKTGTLLGHDFSHLDASRNMTVLTISELVEELMPAHEGRIDIE